MAQQPKLIRVKVLKMFKAPIEGGLPQMIHPGDVVELDRFLAGLMIQSEKAVLTDEKLRIEKEYAAPLKDPSIVIDPFGAVVKAIETLTGTLSGMQLQKGR